MSPPRLIFFDAAMTLIEPHPGVGALYAEIAHEHGVDVEGADLDAGFVPAWRAARAAAGDAPPYGQTYDDALAFWRPVVAQCFSSVGVEMPPDPYFDEVFEAFSTSRAWRVYDDVAPALELCQARGVRAGLLSNFDARLHRLSNELGFRDAFDPFVVSADLGVEKPSAAIYERAAELAGLTGAEIGMIGDSGPEDHDGPAAAGWRAVLVDRNRETAQGDGRTRAWTLVEAVERLLEP